MTSNGGIVPNDRRRPARPNGAARDEAYTAIRRCVKERVARFYQQHPEWLDDERSKQNLDAMIAMLRCILLELDRYDITRIGTPEPVPTFMGMGLAVFLASWWAWLRGLVRRRR